tara:strand:+ start:7076 stop:7957 length:882 start_codon:yes stop_codon:yes gene_type:complete
MKKYFLLLLTILMFFSVFAQRRNKVKPKKSVNAGAFFLHWGYNRNFYTKSDINFNGPGYDFTLQDCQAEDRQKPFGFENYLKLNSLTTPQFNVRVGYMIKRHWAISLGFDHMKYILKDNVPYQLSGTINPGVDLETSWSGTYINEPVITQESSFHYENSNGLNYLRAEVSRVDQWYRQRNSAWFALSSLFGAGVGAIVSINDFTFAGRKSIETQSLSGMALSLHADMRLEFFRHFYIQPGISSGFMLQNNVKTRPEDFNSIASQQFAYLEAHVLFGWLFYLKPVNACDACPQW